MSGGSPHIAPVGADAAAAAVDLMQEAARWAARAGSDLWAQSDFAVAAYMNYAAAGELISAIEDGLMIGCMLLQTSDPVYWPKAATGEALYLHKLAIRRRAAGRGVGAAMIDWALSETQRRHISALRLDTLSTGKLPAYYLALGFRLVEPCQSNGRAMIKMERIVEPGNC